MTTLIRNNEYKTVGLERKHVTEPVIQSIIQNKSIRYLSIFDGNISYGIDIMIDYLLSHRDDVEVEIRQEGNHKGNIYKFRDAYSYKTEDIFKSLACEYGPHINNIIIKWLEGRASTKTKHNNLLEEYERYLLKNIPCWVYQHLFGSFLLAPTYKKNIMQQYYIFVMLKSLLIRFNDNVNLVQS